MLFVLDDCASRGKRKSLRKKGGGVQRGLKVVIIDCSLWSESDLTLKLKVGLFLRFLSLSFFSKSVRRCQIWPIKYCFHRLWEETEEQADTFLLFHH